MQRQWINLAIELEGNQGRKNACRVKVMTWNVLAQKLCNGGPKGFCKVNEAFLTWEHRMPLFKQEILKRNNDGTPFWDIICMQEVDRHHEIFGQEPRFSGTIMSTNEEGRHTNAILFNQERFSFISRTESFYKDTKSGADASQGYISVLLKEKKTGVNFEIFTTHLKAKEGFEQIRDSQMEQLLDVCTGAKHPVILTGDWNDVPDSPAVQRCRSTDGIQHASGDTLPQFTTHKFRQAEGMKTRTIDYVYYIP